MRRCLMAMAVPLLLLLVQPPRAAVGNIESLTPDEGRQIEELSSFYWTETLSEDELDRVRTALESSKSAVVLEAIRVSAVHRLHALVPQLTRIADERGDAAADQAFARIVREALASERDVNAALRARLEAESPLYGDEWRDATGEMKPFEYVRGMIQSTLVVDEARAVRLGRQDAPNLESLELSGYDRELLRASQIPEEQAIEGMLDRLEQSTTLGDAEYDTAGVLETYGRSAIGAILARLSAPERRSAMSEYGKVILVDFLRFQIREMSDSDVRRLRDVVREMRGTDFEPLAKALALVEGQIESGN